MMGSWKRAAIAAVAAIAVLVLAPLSGQAGLLANGDMTMKKTNSPSTFTVGQPGSFTLTITWTPTGTTPAPSPSPTLTGDTFTVIDTLPSGLTYASSSGTGWSCSASGPTVTCSGVEAIQLGGSAPALTINVNVLAAAVPSVTNNASFSDSFREDVNPDDNTASDTVKVNAAATATAAPVTVPPTGAGLTGETGFDNALLLPAVLVLAGAGALATVRRRPQR